LIIILLAFALRFYRLDAQSFWNDEGTSVALAQRDLATITRNAAHDIHPPLYYYSLRGWMLVFGRSAPVGAELAARSLSAFTGLLLVMGTYALARRLWGTGVALLAALFSSLSPFQVYYSQEARMYVGVALFGLLSTLALERLLRHWKEVGRAGSFLWAVLYVLSITAALYTQYYALSLLLAQNIIFLVWLAIRWRHPTGEWRRPLLHWVLVQIVVILAFVPWLWLARGSLRSWLLVRAIGGRCACLCVGDHRGRG
jgi:mannosyltransferase